MRRRLFNFAAAVSLVLSLATLGLWVWSIGQTDEISCVRDAGKLQGWSGEVGDFLLLCPGRLQYAHRMAHREPSFAANMDNDTNTKKTGLRFRRPPSFFIYRQTLPEKSIFLGFGWRRVRYRSQWVDTSDFGVSVPLWSFAALGFLLPLQWVLVVLRHRDRMRFGRCPSCGYSLTGNTSGTCPECGTPVPKEPADKSPRTA
jgi:hypothetical protein